MTEMSKVSKIKQYPKPTSCSLSQGKPFQKKAASLAVLFEE